MLWESSYYLLLQQREPNNNRISSLLIFIFKKVNLHGKKYGNCHSLPCLKIKLVTWLLDLNTLNQRPATCMQHRNSVKSQVLILGKMLKALTQNQTVYWRQISDVLEKHNRVKSSPLSKLMVPFKPENCNHVHYLLDILKYSQSFFG